MAALPKGTTRTSSGHVGHERGRDQDNDTSLEVVQQRGYDSPYYCADSEPTPVELAHVSPPFYWVLDGLEVRGE